MGDDQREPWQDTVMVSGGETPTAISVGKICDDQAERTWHARDAEIEALKDQLLYSRAQELRMIETLKWLLTPSLSAALGLEAGEFPTLDDLKAKLISANE